MEIVEFWKEFALNPSGLNVHEEDKKWLDDRRGFNEKTEIAWQQVFSQERLDFDRFIKSDRFDREGDGRLHLSLCPLSYIGHLETAKVVFLLTNPGFAPCDYRLEADEKFKSRWELNRKQKNANEKYPFFLLDPVFAWSKAFTWWSRRVAPLIGRLKKEGKVERYHDALSYVAKRIAVMELSPYHSTDQGALERLGNWYEMPSAKAARTTAKMLCDSATQVVVLRQHDNWLGKDHADCHCIKSASARGISLNQKSRGILLNPEKGNEPTILDLIWNVFTG